MSFEITKMKTTTYTTDNSAFITPNQLLQQLLTVEVGNCSCKDPTETSTSQSERQLLLKLIQEYRVEIQNKSHEIVDAEKLLEMRDKLYFELEQLKNERARIQQNIALEIRHIQQEHQSRMVNMNGTVKASEEAQLNQLRAANNKLRLRLKDLLEYINRMEGYNQRLINNRALIVSHSKPDTRYETENLNVNVSSREDYLKRIQAKTLQQQQYYQRLQQASRRQQQEILLNVRQQQQQIHRRNRQRLQNVRSNLNTSINNNIVRTHFQPEQTGGSYYNGIYFPEKQSYRN